MRSHAPSVSPLAPSLRRRGWSIWVAVGCVLVAGGCTERLLAPDQPRSQFDRYDAVREQRAPATYTDEFGYQRPNLRGRLLPRE